MACFRLLHDDDDDVVCNWDTQVQSALESIGPVDMVTTSSVLQASLTQSTMKRYGMQDTSEFNRLKYFQSINRGLFISRLIDD